MLIVLTTVPNVKEGETLARGILRDKLAACVQVMPEMRSFYWWEAEVKDEPEHLLLIKTLEEKFDGLSAYIRQNHSYDVPEIVALKPEKVSESYLRWIVEYLGK